MIRLGLIILILDKSHSFILGIICTNAVKLYFFLSLFGEGLISGLFTGLIFS